MTTVTAYLSGIPSPHKSPHKVEVLKRFIEGVNKLGDTGVAHSGQNLIASDIAILQGWVHDGSPSSAHLLLRRRVAEGQRSRNKHTIIVDSNLFNYKDKNHPIHYSRYSMDGVFPTTGNYFWDEPDPARWKQISTDLGISLKDWKTNGEYILLCTQRNGGWSMGGIDVVKWLSTTVATIRKYTNRPIVVRGHPGDKNASQYLNIKNAPWQLSKNVSILDDFKNAKVVVTYNSSPGVAAAIEGVPVFVTDPTPRVSQAYDVANTDLSLIETPQLFERQEWIEKISMCHWTFDELSNGKAWEHFKKYI